MSHDRSHPTDAFGLPEGLLAAIGCALLLVGVFAVASSSTPMPPAEYWAALTTFTLLALGVTLPGCAALYDALGRVVRRDWRALAALAALVPALYLAYALAVREVNGTDLNTAIAFAAVPALAFGGTQGSRRPHLLDAVALGYLISSLWFGLVPSLTLPQQGGLVGFFQLIVIPLLLLLYAGRGWPGLGYTWHLSGRELRDALLAGLAGTIFLLVIGLVTGELSLFPAAPTAGTVAVEAVKAYFFVALPVELLLRGGVQNGLERALRERMGATAAWVALALTVGLATLLALAQSQGTLLYSLRWLVISLAAGWIYKRTGKVTASAVTAFLIVWLITVITGGAG